MQENERTKASERHGTYQVREKYCNNCERILAQNDELRAENERLLFELKAHKDLIVDLTKMRDELKAALEWYASLADDTDNKLDMCLERAMNDRYADKVTVNLTGKYIAEVAVKVLKRHS
jgi:hypothetical protein